VEGDYTGTCDISTLVTVKIFTLNNGESFTASSNEWSEDDDGDDYPGSFTVTYSFGGVTSGASSIDLTPPSTEVGDDECIAIHWFISLE
jgi:hypothetical protein